MREHVFSLALLVVKGDPVIKQKGESADTLSTASERSGGLAQSCAQHNEQRTRRAQRRSDGNPLRSGSPRLVRKNAETLPRKKVGWHPSLSTWIIAALLVGGSAVFLYPKAASWFSQYHQSRELEFYSQNVAVVEPDASQQIAQAHDYNDALNAGAVVVGAGAHKPASSGTSGSFMDYNGVLSAGDSGVMARIKMDSIGLDLPIFHGTDDATLLRGAGHLEGSSLPVGGASTHAVITAHRGLAEATMFSHLDQVTAGDRFSVEVFGEALTYEVRSTEVVDPEDTETLLVQEGRDLITLVTCTPLGINSHRILVTAERVTPTPIEDVRSIGQVSGIPGTPWWLVLGLVVVVGVGVFVWRSGFSDARVRSARAGGAVLPESIWDSRSR